MLRTWHFQNTGRLLHLPPNGQVNLNISNNQELPFKRTYIFRMEIPSDYSNLCQGKLVFLHPSRRNEGPCAGVLPVDRETERHFSLLQPSSGAYIEVKFINFRITFQDQEKYEMFKVTLNSKIFFCQPYPFLLFLRLPVSLSHISCKN